MMSPALLRAYIEEKVPAAFTVCARMQRGSIPTGIPALDSMTGGVPQRAITELCGSNTASSGKTSVLTSLLAQASQNRFCALVDAGDAFDPDSAHTAGVNFSRLLWVRCGKSPVKLRPLEQAFKVTDILLQSSGFGVIAVDISSIPERIVRRVPLSSWFRFSRVIEKQSAALVFLEQEPHAMSCAGLVLKVYCAPVAFTENLLTSFAVNVEVIRGREKKPVRSDRSGFSLQSQWA